MADRITDLTKRPEYKEKQKENWRQRQDKLALNFQQNLQAADNFFAFRQRLSPEERVAIAHNLYWPVEDYYDSHREEERYVLLQKANLTQEKSTRMLARLVLGPGIDDERRKRELYASPINYKLLMKHLCGGDDQAARERAGRLLYGTSFYPQPAFKAIPEVNEDAHLIFAALQEAVNRIDAEFHIHDQFMEVARIRAQREALYWRHVEKTGKFPDYETWRGFDPGLTLPQRDWPDAWPDSEKRFYAENELWWPLDGWRLTDGNFWPSGPLKAPDNAFWLKSDPKDPYAARVGDDADFFYVPHAYLGLSLCMDMLPSGYFSEEQLSELPNLPAPYSKWEESAHSYKLCEFKQTLPKSNSDKEWEFDDLVSTATNWLVVYPDPSTGKLVPMIYSMGEFFGAELMPLTPALIADFANADSWRYFGTDASTLLQRLKILTGYGSGAFKLYEDWRETASRFHWNPILRRHPECIEHVRYRKHLLSWLQKGKNESSKEDIF